MDSSFDLVLRGGMTVTHERVRRLDVAVTDGIVAAVGTDLPAGRDEVDASGLHVLPGLVDAHVHMREPGLTDKGDFATGTRAAAVGGVTTVLEMPNTLPPVADVAGFQAKADLVTPKAHVDFGLYGLFGRDNVGDFDGLAQAGCAGLKLYMGRSVVDTGCPDDAEIVRGLEAARDLGLVVGVHAENDRLVDLYTRRVRDSGTTDPAAHSRARPELAEVEAVTRILLLATAVGAQIHIHHLSSAAALARVAEFRRRGAAVTVEAVLGHLFLSQDDYPLLGNRIKLNPPVRTADDVAALWRAIQRGELDLVATDHAPHSDTDKTVADLWCAQSGFPGVDVLLPLMLSETLGGRLELPDLVRLCAYRPARRWSLDGKGTLEPGADADLVLVDTGTVTTIGSPPWAGTTPASPFYGKAVAGALVATYLRGQLIASGGTAFGPPRGRLIRPARKSATVPR